MNVLRYRVVLYVHIFLILLDLSINTFIDILRPENVVQLLIFVFQDTSILFTVIIIFLMFFSTYVFQAGLIWTLIMQFRMAVVMSPAYLALSIALHVWKLTLCWDDPYKYIWSSSYLALFVIQRTAAIFYYYFYHQMILRIADPKFYQRSDWLIREISKH